MEFVEKVINKVATLLSVDKMIAMLILAGAALVVLLLLVVIIAVAVKKNRKKKLANKQEEVQAQEQAKEEVASAEEVVEPVAEPVKTEEVKEEVAVVEEQPAPQVEEQPVEKKTVAKKTATKSATPKKTTAKKVEEEPVKKEVKPAKKLNGKWTIQIKREKEYIAQLLASNGEIMLNSEVYSSPEGARNGVNTIINGVKNGKFVVYSEKSGEYYFKLKSANNKLVCAGEIYKTKERCLSAVESVKRIAENSPIVEGVDVSHKFVDFTIAPLDEKVLSGAKGKWKVEQTEQGLFLARLYANNGQVMLSTEEVSKKANAVTSIESVKKNAEAGNFVIDKDKFGRFYYKLRNVQKSVICIGEAYDSLESCVSAIESVRKFALNSPVV